MLRIIDRGAYDLGIHWHRRRQHQFADRQSPARHRPGYGDPLLDFCIKLINAGQRSHSIADDHAYGVVLRIGLLPRSIRDKTQSGLLSWLALTCPTGTPRSILLVEGSQARESRPSSYRYIELAASGPERASLRECGALPAPEAMKEGGNGIGMLTSTWPARATTCFEFKIKETEVIPPLLRLGRCHWPGDG
jgi:hypothetical protein